MTASDCNLTAAVTAAVFATLHRFFSRFRNLTATWDFFFVVALSWQADVAVDGGHADASSREAGEPSLTAAWLPHCRMIAA